MGSPRVEVLASQGVAIRAKASTSTNGGRFPKQAFLIDLVAAQVVCPAQQRAAIPVGATSVHFAATVCQPCPQRPACVHDCHPRRALHRDPCAGGAAANLAGAPTAPDGRARLHKHTAVEQALARVDQIQGPKARYKACAKTPSTSDASPSLRISSGWPGSRRPRDFTCSALYYRQVFSLSGDVFAQHDQHHAGRFGGANRMSDVRGHQHD